MYTIIEREDGRFQCECRMQSDCERWISDTEEEAVREMKQAALVLNNAKIKRKDIEFLRWERREVRVAVPRGGKR
jgi:hypothetical protein